MILNRVNVLGHVAEVQGTEIRVEGLVGEFAIKVDNLHTGCTIKGLVFGGVEVETVLKDADAVSRNLLKLSGHWFYFCF